MKRKDFCQKAVEHGYKKSNVCVGWDWIQTNLAELDWIFQTPEYLACKGMKHTCFPLLCGDEDLTDIEKDILSTAWYLNNGRQRERTRLEHRKKMLNKGWLLLSKEVFSQAIKSGKKLLLKAAFSHDWLAVSVDGVYRPYDDNGSMFLIAPHCRRKGYRLETLTEHGERDAFCKLV